MLFDKGSTVLTTHSQLVIFIGIQGCGKTSFFNMHLAATHVHVSKDHFRNAKNRDVRQAQLVETALSESRSVAVDNTNPTAADRAPLVEAGRRFGVEIVGYYFESRIEECLKRNRLREGKSRVPDVALYATLSKLERPLYLEGFDRLFYVKTGEPFQFEVQEWIEDED